MKNYLDKLYAKQEKAEQFKQDFAATLNAPDENTTTPSVAKRLEDINRPAHYTSGGIETIDVIQSKSSPEEFLGFLKGSVLKYITRAGKKESLLKDLQKARWYLDKWINAIEDIEK